jgi:phage-related minor tail protein
MMELADGLLESTTELDPEDERVLEDLMRGLLDLRLRNLRQEIEYLEFMQKDAQEQGDVKASQYRQIMVQLAQKMLALNKALKEYTERSTVRRKM